MYWQDIATEKRRRKTAAPPISGTPIENHAIGLDTNRYDTYTWSSKAM